MKMFITIATGAGFLLLAVAVSYFLEKAGEPQSVWVWELIGGIFK